jgi:hypothetical protein
MRFYHQTTESQTQAAASSAYPARHKFLKEAWLDIGRDAGASVMNRHSDPVLIAGFTLRSDGNRAVWGRKFEGVTDKVLYNAPQ